MANALYGLGRQAFATAGVNWLTDNIYCVLADLNDFTNSITTLQYLSSIPTGARIATFGPLTSKTASLGVLDAADFSFLTVTGDQAEALIFYKNTGTDSTSPLLIFLDTATGLPVTPNGGNIAVVLDAAGIATL